MYLVLLLDVEVLYHNILLITKEQVVYHQGFFSIAHSALEGVAHLVRNGVAHRDLKGDNLLVNETSSSLPHLVIADFDCCFAEKNFGLVMPFETAQTDKGGNSWLMAPEVQLPRSDAPPSEKIAYI